MIRYIVHVREWWQIEVEACCNGILSVGQTAHEDPAVQSFSKPMPPAL